MSEIITWSAVETVRRLKNRDVSAVEVTEAHLARLAAVNPKLNACVQDVPDAMEQASAIDKTGGESLLAGAPVTTKINTDQRDLPNSNGLPGLANHIAEEDAPVVANLRQAGGVIIGRTNTPEFSLRWCTSNPLHGVSLNPWNHEHTPGGSSGAAAAAVASGIGVLAHGNDLGGSIRYPAFCCGIAGLKPSIGRIPAWNPSAPAERPPVVTLMSVQGPIARSVADVQLGLAAMRSHSPNDPNWTSAPANGRLRKEGRGRIAFVPHPFSSETHPALAQAVEDARLAAKIAGFETVMLDLPETERCANLWGRLLFTETQTMMEESIRSLGSSHLQGWIDQFTQHFEKFDLKGYMRAMSERYSLQRLWAQMFEEVDFVVMPTSLLPPFENDLDFNDPTQAKTIIEAQKPLCVVNLIGLPALALPTGLSNGLPIGVQIVGPMHDDDAVIEVGLMMEKGLGNVLDSMPAPYGLSS
ncbi:MAG: amidase [Pseudomonadota bacterium]